MMSRLVILYGIGGLSDVGRHALQAALDRSDVLSIKVLTQHPQLLEEPNWKCGCPTPHIFSEQDRKRFQVINVTTWDEKDADLTKYFEGASAVISCLGNRQPGLSEPELKRGWVAHEGSKVVIQAMQKYNIHRAVVMSSVGVEEDWPPMEFFWMAKVILGFLFVMPGLVRKAYHDLTDMERAFRRTSLDYLLVRPVGLGEDVLPTGTWKLQKKKYEDVVGGDMAKLDCARFMVQEALAPTLHQTAVVIGSVPDDESAKTEL